VGVEDPALAQVMVVGLVMGSTDPLVKIKYEKNR